MRTYCYLMLLIWMTAMTSFAAQAGDTKKVLMLISGYATPAQPELSYDLEELAQAYLVLHDNGLELDIATPQGGPVLVKSNKDDLSFIQRFKSIATKKLHNTLSTSNIEPDNYHAVFIVGGAGAMLDLPKDRPTQTLLTDFVAQKRIIAAVCHGPAAIANIKLPNGQFFVAGKQVNAFTNIEESAFSGEHISLFPFLVQDKLIENGGNFVHNDPMLPFVAVDETLITAQNPSSVPKAAETLLLKLGITPKSRTAFKDEATMQLLAIAKQTGIAYLKLALAQSPDDYDLNYLALYGFYAYSLATDDLKNKELDVMTAIASYFQHPAYESALIRALYEQKRLTQAKKFLNLFLKRYPSNAQGPELSGLLDGTLQG